MANPWGVERPEGFPPDLWDECEKFANAVYQDIPGNWIEQWVTHHNSFIDFAALFHEQWAALLNDQERWLYAVNWRLDTLVDEQPLRDFLKDIAPLVLRFVGLPDLTGGGSGGRDIPDIGDIDDNNRDSEAELRYATNVALNSLAETGRRSTDIVTGIGSLVLSAIDDRNRSSTDSILGLVDTSTRGIDDLLRAGAELLGDLTGQTMGGIDALLEDIFGKNAAILQRIFGVIDGSLDHANENNARVTDAIVRSLDSEVRQAQENSDAITRGLERSLEEITGASDSALSEAVKAFLGASGTGADATRAGSVLLSESIGEPLKGLGKFVSRLTGEGDNSTPEGARDRINKSFDRMLAEGNCPKEFGAFVHDFIDRLTSDWDPTTPLMHLLAEVELIKGIFEPALTVLGNCVAQTAARAVPTSLPSAADLQEQMKHGLVSKAEAMNDLLSQGYTPERADRLLALRRRLPEVGFIQTWFVRGMIKADDAFGLLDKLGFELDDAQAILEMAYTIPPPADLITMAVREAFSPNVAQRFGQFEDFPEAFAQYALQQGITEDWAKRYWAAHWSLPSPQQGFEMYQRDVISRQDLELLLRALDIMPFWREKLTQIAFRPVTRVDIRRMHQLGLIDHAEMVKRYRHMGYSPEDAEFMAKFTERLHAPKGEQDVEELEGATKATILQLYKRGVITRAQAGDLLKEMGTGERAINVLLTNTATALELEHRDAETDLLLEQAGAGVITIDAARDRLGSLGLTAIEQQRAATKLEKIRAKQSKLPTRGEAEKMFRNDIISSVEYGLVLRQLGYSVFWIDRFISLARVEEPA